MKLSFLGTGAGNFRGGRRQPCSAYLDGLLLDCGAGATGRLHDLGRFVDVDCVLISHLHTDHVSGLYDFLLHTLITGRQRPLTIVSPPGLSAILRVIVAAGGTVRDPAELYDLRLVEDLRPDVTVGPWRIRGVPLDHTLPDIGYLVARDGFSLFYTGDTREPSATRDVTADILLHEATFSETDRDRARQFGHSTGAQAGAAAAAMKARRLVLTHLGDATDLDHEVAREAKRSFPDTIVASDVTSFDL